MNKIIHLSHNDLDGVGCSFVLRRYNNPDVTIHTKYADIQKYIQEINTDIITTVTEEIYITDLSFKLEDLIELARLVINHKDINFTYIDHHPYDEKSMNLLYKLNEKDNFTLLHTEKFCATYLTYKLCDKKFKLPKKLQKDADLESLVKDINAYDIWLRDSKRFNRGFFLNTIFWKLGVNKFKSAIMNNNYKAPERFISDYKKLLKDKNDYFKIAENNGLIMKDEEDIYIAFISEYSSFIQIDNPNTKFIIVINLKSKIMSFRIHSNYNKNEELKNNIIQFLESYPNTISCGGHSLAFGASFLPETPEEDLMSITESCYNIFNELK